MFFFGKTEAVKFKPRTVEHAYLCILNDDLLSAEAIFESLDSPRARWGKALLSIIKGYIEDFPTYFEIRNFLEIDLDFLLKNEKNDYVEQLLGSLEHLILINQETYKYTARVMFENKLYNACRKYMEKSKSIIYNDPELHFMYANYYYKFNEYTESLNAIEECIKILPNYYPAKLLRSKIQAILR